MSTLSIGDSKGVEMRLDIPPELERALKSGNFGINPARAFLLRSGFQIQAGAQDRAPVDTGRLRSSLAVVERDNGDTVLVRSRLKYAAPQEFGTRPFWPPWSSSSFQRWARRKGANAFLVARAISRRGIRPKRFLTNSWNSFMQNRLHIEIQKLKDDIEDAWRKVSA